MDTIQITDMAGAKRLTGVMNPADAGHRAADFLVTLNSFGAIAPAQAADTNGTARSPEEDRDDAKDTAPADLGEWLLPGAAPVPCFLSVPDAHTADCRPNDKARDLSAIARDHFPTAIAPGQEVVSADERGFTFAEMHVNAWAEIADPGDGAPLALPVKTGLSALPAPTGTNDIAKSGVVVKLSSAELPTDIPTGRPMPTQILAGDQSAVIFDGHRGQPNDRIDVASNGIPDKNRAAEGGDTKRQRAPTDVATIAPPPPMAGAKTPILSFSYPAPRFGGRPDDAPRDRMAEPADDGPPGVLRPAGRGQAPESTAVLVATGDGNEVVNGAAGIAVANSDLADDTAPVRTASGMQATAPGPREGSAPPEISGQFVDREPRAKGSAQTDNILPNTDSSGLRWPPSEARGLERAAETAPLPIGHRILPPGVGHQLADSAARFPGQPVEVTLTPEELGKVRMTLTTTDGGLTLSLVADRPETLVLMRRHIDQLAQDFRDLGFQNLSFSFAHGRDQGRASGAAFVPDDEMPLTDAIPRGPRPQSLNSLPPVPADGLDIRM